jgi:PHD/YefM family antitoxin component YafN of YafNO toxin-antitoxin module
MGYNAMQVIQIVEDYEGAYMSTLTMRSEEARVRMRDILDQVIAGGEVVIERYRKPTAVVVNFDRWNQMQRQFLALLDQRRAEMRNGELDGSLSPAGNGCNLSDRTRHSGDRDRGNTPARSQHPATK